MNPIEDKNVPTTATDAQRAALTSPLRLEIVGLFTSLVPLSIADMAERMGRSPVSLYHHVGILEGVGLLERAGVRPKGKRYETLFALPDQLPIFDPDPDDPMAVDDAVRMMSSAFRMAERDLAAALSRSDIQSEGPSRNLLATRVHMRVSKKTLAALNDHIDSILAILSSTADTFPDPSPEDELLSLTLALLPLRGRDPRKDLDPTPSERPDRRKKEQSES